ncbi:EP15R-like protein [Mya arenaria]|uniref:EP15R-like protein n=1 Tax=Mya arenaria TaxID=6604 RepID=A0ABY7FNF2_MYAAR|nr:EP15R-like protein [Mya arenaria]
MASFPPLPQADPNNTGSVGALDAANFMKKSGIWDMSDPTGKGYLEKQGFFVALKLISLVQSGQELNIAKITSETPQPNLANEKSKYDQVFDSLQPVNNLLAGDRVRPAMHLVHKGMAKEAIPMTLTPGLIPPSKRKGHLPPGAVSVLPGGRNTPTLRSDSPALRGHGQVPWVVTPADKVSYEAMFRKADLDMDGYVSGQEIRDIFLQSGLPNNILAHICYKFEREKLKLEAEQQQQQADIRLCQVEVQRLEKELNNVTGTLHQLEAQKIDAQKVLDELEEKKMDLETTVREIKQKCEDEQKQINSLNSQIENQQKSALEQDEELNKLRIELQKLREEENTLEQKVEAGKTQLEQLSKSQKDVILQVNQEDPFASSDPFGSGSFSSSSSNKQSDAFDPFGTSSSPAPNKQTNSGDLFGSDPFVPTPASKGRTESPRPALPPKQKKAPPPRPAPPKKSPASSPSKPSRPDPFGATFPNDPFGASDPFSGSTSSAFSDEEPGWAFTSSTPSSTSKSTSAIKCNKN